MTGQIPGTLSLVDCSDQHRREVSCEPGKGSDERMCACERDGTLGRTFNWPSTRSIDAKERRELEDVLRRQCHWSLRLR